jgi:transcriptional regulator with XRE-family HTH domain
MQDLERRRGWAARETTSAMTIGAQIQRIRLAHGVSLSELSKQSGVKRDRLETMEATAWEPRPAILQRIAAALGVPLDALLPPATTTGARIARLRLLRGWGVAELAQHAGLEVGTVQRLEKGRAEPSVRTVQALAAVLGVSVDACLADNAVVRAVRDGGRPQGWTDACALAKGLGVHLPDVAVMSMDADPFVVGTPAHQRDAQWFSTLWARYQFARSVHLRRIHYVLLSHGGVTFPNGETYENRDSHFARLSDASRYARILHLVDASALDDHRNPVPVVRTWSRPAPEPSWQLTPTPPWWLPQIAPSLAYGIHLDVPQIEVDGYDYDGADQPYHLEVWIEKSTMDDVLVPLCETYGATLVTSVGFQSISSVVKLLLRVARIGKPVRIFYISDLDPAGDCMPAAVARQVEYWCADYAPDADIKLHALALTTEQAAQYQLPRIPIKDTDRRANNFEERHGKGAVELDALEALYPGTLAQIVRGAMRPYQDDTLPRRLAAADNAALRLASHTVLAALDSPTSAARAAIVTDAYKILGQYTDRLIALRRELETELEPIRERMDEVREELDAAAEDFALELPARPEPEVDPPDESDWLFDAGRDYLQQLAVYKARKAVSGSVDDEDDGAA